MSVIANEGLKNCHRSPHVRPNCSGFSSFSITHHKSLHCNLGIPHAPANAPIKHPAPKIETEIAWQAVERQRCAVQGP